MFIWIFNYRHRGVKSTPPCARRFFCFAIVTWVTSNDQSEKKKKEASVLYRLTNLQQQRRKYFLLEVRLLEISCRARFCSLLLTWLTIYVLFHRVLKHFDYTRFSLFKTVFFPSAIEQTIFVKISQNHAMIYKKKKKKKWRNFKP